MFRSLVKRAPARFGFRCFSLSDSLGVAMLFDLLLLECFVIWLKIKSMVQSYAPVYIPINSGKRHVIQNTKVLNLEAFRLTFLL